MSFGSESLAVGSLTSSTAFPALSSSFTFAVAVSSSSLDGAAGVAASMVGAGSGCASDTATDSVGA